MVVAPEEEVALAGEVAGEDVSERNDNNNSPYKIVFRKSFRKAHQINCDMFIV
jgi:hypothetical protein